MKYVVTGATSFLGRALTERLLRAGHSVVAVCRQGSPAIASLPAGAEVVLADMSDYGKLYQDIAEADVWLNLAWEGTGHDGRDMADVQHANVINTIAAMFCADKMGCRLFVESGSQAEYGTVLSTISETTPCHPFSEYGKAKSEVCRQLTELSAQLGVSYLHLRIFSLFGEGDHPWTLIMSSLGKMLRDEPIALSACTQQWNFLYVADAAEQISRLCDYALTHDGFTQDTFNIASDDTRPLRSFIDEMYRLTKSHSELQFGALPQQHTVSLQPDMKKLRQTIGYVSTTPFADAIQRIIYTLQHDKS